MRVALIISSALSFGIALYELTWFDRSSLAVVLFALASIMGFLAAAIYKVSGDLDKIKE